jgi:hypothetical protein
MPYTHVLVRKNGNNLDVDDNGVGIPVAAGQGLHFITWELDPVTLPNATFLPMHLPPSQDGWTMLSTFRKGLFSDGTVAEGRRHLSVVVDHPSSVTKGPYNYMLRARDGNKTYSTLFIKFRNDPRTVTNPIIINK